MLLFAGPVFMIRCLARVDFAVDGLEVVGVVASYDHGQVAESLAESHCPRVQITSWCLYQKMHQHILWRVRVCSPRFLFFILE